MNNRERFHAIVKGLPFDRLPIIEWAEWWDQTIARWHAESLPAHPTSRYDICEHFGLDVWWQGWWCPTAQGAPSPAHHGAGIVASEADYNRLRPFFFQIRDRWPLNPDVWEAAAARQRAGDWVLWFTVEGFFWYPRTLLGIERHLFAFYDQPELIHRINQDLADWMVQ